MLKSDYLSKRMSEGVDIDPSSPEIVQELLDVLILYSFLGDFWMDQYLRNSKVDI